MHLYYGDLADPSSLINSLNRIRPDEVYNLRALAASTTPTNHAWERSRTLGAGDPGMMFGYARRDAGTDADADPARARRRQAAVRGARDRT